MRPLLAVILALALSGCGGAAAALRPFAGVNPYAFSNTGGGQSYYVSRTYAQRQSFSCRQFGNAIYCN
jgi:hypothetical protein